MPATLRQRLESAVVAVLAVASPGTPFAGIALVESMSDADRPMPCIIVECADAPARNPERGLTRNHTCRLRVLALDHAHDVTDAAMQERAQAVADALTDIPALRAACAARAIHLYTLHHMGQRDGQVGDHFGVILEFEAPCVDNPSA